MAEGPLLRRVAGQGKHVGPDRLNDQEVARLVKKTALAAGVRGDLSEAERGQNSAAPRCARVTPPRPRSTSDTCKSSSAIAEITRRYQRRGDRLRINLTKAAGLCSSNPLRDVKSIY